MLAPTLKTNLPPHPPPPHPGTLSGINVLAPDIAQQLLQAFDGWYVRADAASEAGLESWRWGCKHTCGPEPLAVCCNRISNSEQGCHGPVNGAVSGCVVC